jgi:hypothetical protein
VEVSVDFNNISKYWRASWKGKHKKMGSIDKQGITTIYHELLHVSAYLKSAPGSGILWPTAHLEAQNQDKPSSGSGPAQTYGESVYLETSILPAPLTNISVYHFQRIKKEIESRQANFFDFIKPINDYYRTEKNEN